MSAITHPETIAIDTAQDTEGLGGHPRGLTTLFFTELWERFSYYGMRAILILFMTAPLAQGGLGFDVPKAASIYGWYTMAVYLLALPGGLIADKVFGARLAVLIGGIIIACGHFSMAFHSMVTFYAGLILIAVGTGLLKPNISTMVGSLYSKDDPRRDGGFSLFYMGINLGAFAAPLVVGTLAEHKQFKGFLSSMGFDPLSSWHWGFGAAGVGMVFGLILYLLPFSIRLSPIIGYPLFCGTISTLIGIFFGVGRIAALVGVGLGLLIAFLGKRPIVADKGLVYIIPGHPLANVGNRTNEKNKEESVIHDQPLTSAEWKRIAAIVILFFFTILFWAAYEQKGASLNLFAKNLVDTQIFGWQFPASWLQALTPLYVIMLAPIFSILWMRLGQRQPSSPAKFAFGLLFIGLAYTLFVPACVLTAQGKVSPLWLVGLYFLEVVGEMCLSPVGLSTVTKLSPVKFVGLMMGAWFFATSLGNKLAGYLAGFYVSNNSWQLVKLYGGIAIGLLIAAVVLALLTPTIKKLVGQQS